MILFGLWHKATSLFVLWGSYHGVLLVLHRQIQQLQRKFDWSPPALWTPISWAATISLISLGWIFFRANNLLQARQMLSAVLSPASYVSHFLSGNLYLLVLTLALGYAVVLLVVETLNGYSVELKPANRHFIWDSSHLWLAGAGFGFRLCICWHAFLIDRDADPKR